MLLTRLGNDSPTPPDIPSFDNKTRLVPVAGGEGLPVPWTIGEDVDLCYWVSVIAYPLNIGGRPLNSWPSFIPVTFEVTILLASFTAVLAMLGLNGLPMPYHPVFNVKRFAESASQDGFFLAIEAEDPQFDREKTRAFLQGLGAKDVNEIEP